MNAFRPLVLLAILASCAPPPNLRMDTPAKHGPLPPLHQDLAGAARSSGLVGVTETLPPPLVSTGTPPATPGPAEAAGPAEITLDFADTDIREVVRQILGGILGLNYIIDPAVHGSITLRTTRALSRAQLLPVLQAMLAENGATIAQSGELYRVLPSTAAAGTVAAGSTMVVLHHAAAEDLAKVLQPFAGNGGRIAAEPGRNAIIVAADADLRDSLIAMVHAFDVDTLAGQSYALFPVAAGTVRDFAAALQDALHTRPASAEGARGGAGSIRVVPMERINAVLVVSPQPQAIEEARRVYTLVDRARRQTVRAWHVTYLQNSDANDVAYVLQSAFTPNSVTAQPRSQANSLQGTSGGARGGMGGSMGGGMGGGFGGAGLGGGGLGGNGLASGGTGTSQVSQTPLSPPGTQASGGNPLLGGLDTAGGATSSPDAMRIIPNDQNSALMVYATAQEYDAITAMLRKIDIVTRQVRIDATIAEVTLNDQLQYGTQFFFRSGGINGILSFANQQIGNPQQATLNSQFPGFFLGGRGAGGAPFAINALQAITTVNVLSSPQLLVLDNQSARLQVGNLVPYLAQTSQSTLAPGAPVINSINYLQTGVIMQIRPRVNAGGLVTLDIVQEVSDVNTEGQVAGINSPTFLERNVSSRVVVQDGQTIGLAGLIRDSSSRGNDGLPWLKDIPVLGLLGGKQDNTRARTELLVLITPHVIEDQRDARALTEDLREQLGNAAAVPALLGQERVSGSNDPSAALRQKLAPIPR